MIVRGEDISRDFLRKRRGSNVFTAVRSCNIELRAGEISVIMGRSGSGKSTLLNMLSGILKPTTGRVMYDETDIYSLDDTALSAFRNENIGFVPQGKSAVASLTVLENVMIPKLLYGGRDEERAMELLSLFGIADLKDVMPAELSGGELRRMAIARALINSPGVLFCDEPTGDLDNENTKAVFDALYRVADNGSAVFIVTHEDDARLFANRLYVMDAGVINEVKV